MSELEWLELARADLLEIVDYIFDDNPDTALRVLHATQLWPLGV